MVGLYLTGDLLLAQLSTQTCRYPPHSIRYHPVGPLCSIDVPLVEGLPLSPALLPGKQGLCRRMLHFSTENYCETMTVRVFHPDQVPPVYD